MPARKLVEKEQWTAFEVLLTVRFELLDVPSLVERRARFVVDKETVWRMRLSVPSKVTKVRAGRVYRCEEAGKR